MFGIGLAAMCGTIAWAIAFKRLIVIGEPDPFGFIGWQARAFIVGGGLIACLAVSRYLTYRSGRGMRMGLANFMLLAGVLVVFFCSLFYLLNGGDLADGLALARYGKRIAWTYGAPAFAAFAAFLACELLLGRL